MSRQREILIIETSAGEVRVARARAVPAAAPSSGRSDSVVHLTDVCSFYSSQKDADASPLSDQTVLDALAAHLKEHHQLRSDAIFVFGGSAVSSQYFDMPPLTGKSLHQAVVLKLRQQLHFPVEQAALMIRTVGGVGVSAASTGAGQVRVQATAVQRGLVDDALAVIRRHGLNPLAMCAATDVLAAAAAQFIPASERLQAVLNIEERHSTLVVLHQGQPCVCADLPVAAADITAALMRPIISGDEVIQLEERKAVELRDTIGIPEPETRIESVGVTGDRLLPLLEPFMQKLVKQLTQWLTFATTSTGCNVERLHLVGLGAGIKGLSETLSARTTLQVDIGRWMEDASAVEPAGGSASAKSFGIAALAAQCWRSLPDVSPPEFRREQRIHRVRRGLAVCGPVVAAAIIVMAVLLERVGGYVQSSLGERQQELSGIERQIAEFKNQWARIDRLATLEGQFEEFGFESPHWVGVFKELSLLLPPELQATEYQAETRDANVILTVRATVIADHRGRSFDEVVTQTLLLLQRSAFFKRVEVVSANREQGGQTPNVAGVLSVQLDLAYPRGKRPVARASGPHPRDAWASRPYQEGS